MLELRNSNGRLRATVELAKVAERLEGALKLHNLNGGAGKSAATECLDVYYQGGRLRIELAEDRIDFWDFLGRKILTLPTVIVSAPAEESASNVTRLVGISDKKNRLGITLVSDPEGLGDIAPWRLRLLPLQNSDWPRQLAP